MIAKRNGAAPGGRKATISVEEAVSLVLADSDRDLSHKDGLVSPFIGSFPCHLRCQEIAYWHFYIKKIPGDKIPAVTSRILRLPLRGQ
jgi:hypothetical protein